jgi:hypothetical protein
MANHNRTFCGPPPSYCARNCSIAADKPRYPISSWMGVRLPVWCKTME